MHASVTLSFWRALETFAPTADAFVAVTILSLARRWSWLGHASVVFARALSNMNFADNFHSIPNSTHIQITQHHLLRVQYAPCATSSRNIPFKSPHAPSRDTQNRFFPRSNNSKTIFKSTIIYPTIFLTDLRPLNNALAVTTRINEDDILYVLDEIKTIDDVRLIQQLAKSHSPISPCAAETFPVSPSIQSSAADTNDELHRFKVPLVVHLTAEAYVGILHGTEGALPPEEAAYLATARMQNRWLYLFFDHLAQHAPDSPEHQALLIALGLAQYQTTGMWPWGAWWHQTFAGEAPTHWLPAAMWHMCFAVGEPDNPTHEAAVDAAFARGADPNNPEAWPELAEALRQHRLHATPPEVLALYDHGDATGDEASGDA